MELLRWYGFVEADARALSLARKLMDFNINDLARLAAERLSWTSAYDPVGLAEEFSIPLDDGTLPAILADRDLKSDPIHPNAEGYRVLAEAVHDLLADAGAVD